MNAAGIIFSNLKKDVIPELTSDRTLAAVPFGCRYRFVDFCLSNMINADISNICIVANYNYRSLVDHIGSGKDWDLARRKGGIQLIAPFLTARTSDSKPNNTHLESLVNMKDYISDFKEDYVVVMDADQVVNIDLSSVIDTHAQSGADITMVTKKICDDYSKRTYRIMAGTTDGRITQLCLSKEYKACAPEMGINIFVMRKNYLLEIIDAAEDQNCSSLTDLLLRTYKEANYRTYCYDGYVASVMDLLEYYQASMELASSDTAKESLLWRKDAPIFTKVHNSAPTIYHEDAVVRDSMIADDCVIEGTVINSILSRNVRVAKGAVVKNSVLFWGTTVGKDASLNCVITDKDVFITDGVSLSGNQNLPIYIEKLRKI